MHMQNSNGTSWLIGSHPSNIVAKIQTGQIPLFGLARPRVDLVIDVANLAMRAAYRFRELSFRDQPTGHIFGSLSILLHLKQHYDRVYQTRLVFALEGRCQWRRDLLPTYKANRGQRIGTATTIQEVGQILGLLPGLTVCSPDNEADDAVAAHTILNPQLQHVIYTSDHDLWQLIAPNVQVVRATKEDPISIYQIDETFQTTKPQLIPLAKALVGDVSDNVPGVKGFLRQDMHLLFAELDGPDVDQLIEVAHRLDQAGQLKPRTLRLLTQHDEHVRRMLRVTTLNGGCQPIITINQPDRRALQTKLADLAINSLLDKLDTFYGAA
jgi:5'-3' exonuclease